MRTRFPALLLLASAAAFAADRDFDRLVKGVENQFGVRRTYIPLMGVANFFVKVARPAGTSGFRLAVFEDLRFSDYSDTARIDRLMAEAASGLQPMVRVRSRRNHELTYIYTGDFGKTTRMLIATFEPDDATIVEVKVNLETLARIVKDPPLAGKMYGWNFDRKKERMREP